MSSSRAHVRVPPPPSQRRELLHMPLTCIIEGSFYDGMDIKAKAPTKSKDTDQNGLQEKKVDVHRSIAAFVVVYTMIFFNGCCFTAVVPSVPFYLLVLGAPPSFLGLVVSFYSLGQVIGSPIAGCWNDRVQSKTLLTSSSLLGLAASTLYVTAPNHWFVLASRLITGVSAGMEFTTELAFIARNTTTKERTAYLASVTAVNVLGFIMGPALATLLSMLDFEFGSTVINQYTGPGWLLVLMFFIDLLMIRFLFEDAAFAIDPNLENESTSGLLANKVEEGSISYGAVSKETDVEQHMDNGVKSEQPVHPSLPIVLGLVFTQFTLMCAWSVLETITSPLAADSFGWSVQECNILFTLGGVTSLLAYASFVIASKWIDDRWLVVYALISCFLGLLLLINWTLPIVPPYKYCFLAGYLIMNAGFMTGRPVTFALYSKLVPSEFQGKYLGWMVTGGSAARTFGPFVAVYLYYHIDGPWKNTLALFGSECGIMAICLVLIIALWQSLSPAKSNVQQTSSEHKKLLSKSPNGISLHTSSRSKSINNTCKGLPGKNVDCRSAQCGSFDEDPTIDASGEEEGPFEQLAFVSMDVIFILITL